MLEILVGVNRQKKKEIVKEKVEMSFIYKWPEHLYRKSNGLYLDINLTKDVKVMYTELQNIAERS